MDLIRLKKIKTLEDIKQEKARLRFEILLAENSLNQNLQWVQRIFTIEGLVTRIVNAVKFGQDVFYRLAGIFSWFSDTKAQSENDQ